MSHFFQINIKTIIKSTIERISTIISVIKLSDTGRLAIPQVRPKTRRILNILLHTTFQIAISDCFFIEATIEVTNSGAEVHRATTVRPITVSETLNERAILLAELTSKSAQRLNQTSHKNT